MKKILIIACYFGELPNYFEYWKKSCEKNYKIDFLFVTDQNIESVSSNFKVLNFNFYEFKTYIKNKLKIDIADFEPYKLCDFKPSYGCIFKDYIKEYDFWGYCDIDLIFGDIRKFVTDEILEKNSIILNLGHLTLFKNVKEINELFKSNGSIYSYIDVFASKEHFAFDEMSGMHRIYRKNNIVPYMNIPIADIDKRFSSNG